MKLLLSFLLFVMGFEFSSAQPGGGGGVNILHIANTKDIRGAAMPMYPLDKDSGVKVRFYVLSDDPPHQPLMQYQPKPRDSFRNIGVDEKKARIYVPPVISIQGVDRPITTQRIEIEHWGLVMTVDIINIPPPNPAGLREQLKAVQFYPGRHVRLNMDINSGIAELKRVSPLMQEHEMRELLWRTLRQGINDNNYEYLKKYGLLTEVNPQQLSPQKDPFVWKEADTVLNISCRVYKVPLEAIMVRDHEAYSISAQINFMVPGLLTSLDSMECRLLLDKYIPPRPWFKKDSLLPEERFVSDLYEALKTDKVSINGQLFTGVLRLYNHDWWYDLARRPSPSISVLINRYKNGVLVESNAMYDVGSMCNDWMQVRPT